MNRRRFLGLVSASALAGCGVHTNQKPESISTLPSQAGNATTELGKDASLLHNPAIDSAAQPAQKVSAEADLSNAALDSLNESSTLLKVQNFDNIFSDDVILEAQRMPVLLSLHKKLRSLQSYVGYANFSILGFEESRAYARNTGKLEDFTSQELELVNDLFNVDAREYGFLGERINYKLNDRISRKELIKVPATGQYVYKGQSLATFHRLKADIGHDLILTSGIRGITKQLYLFVNKAVKVDGNLSRASRSLAPPGHSYHAIGDFDVGMRGLGELNFTKEFANTSVYTQIHKLKYINIRYHETNTLGVRYEPWHIKVV